MEEVYSGKIEKKTAKKNRFDWGAFVAWICSLLISFIPLYVSMYKWYDENGSVDLVFWSDAFLHKDILWVFSTVLLFCLVDAYAIAQKGWVKVIIPIGILVFVLTETTWFVFNYILNRVDGILSICLGIAFIVFVLLVATPLKISYIKEGK